MQTTSQLYKDILANPAHQKEWKAIIYDGETGTEYGQNNIVSIRLNSQLYGNALIGNACSGSMDLVLKKSENFPIIPKMAKIEPYVRLVSSLYQWEKRSVITAYFWNKYTVGHRYYWNRYVNIVTHHWKKYSVDVIYTDTNLGTTGTKNYVNGPYKTMAINAVPPIVVIDGQPKYDFSGGRNTTVQNSHTPVGSYCAANNDSIKTATGGIENYHSYYAKVLSIKDNSILGAVVSSDANAEIHGIQTTRNRGTYIEDVSSTNQISHPQDGEQDGFWYVYDGYTQERGPFIDSVNSKNQSAFPQDGAQGNYWYVYDRSEDYRGDFIGEVSGIRSDEYPQDSIQNGYWYVYNRSEQQKGELIDTITSENANAYPQDGIQDGYWYVFEGKTVSEWLAKGTYWINQREEDIVSDTVTLHCVDGMMFGERDFFLPNDPISSWENEAMRTVAGMCAEKMGLTLEDPNQFQYARPYRITAAPEGYTVRQVLSGIAAAHGGNVVVTPNNKIRLVPFVPTNTNINIGTNIANFILAKQYEAFGQVIFNFEGIDGDTLTVLYPDVDEPEGPIIETKMLAVTDSEDAEDMVQAVYQSLGSYLYTPYTATDAILDPAMELGDGFTINGTYSVLASLDEICDALYSATIGAPSFDETENEFVYQPKTEKNIQRQIAKTRTSFKIGIDGIIAHVTDAQGNYNVLTIAANGSIFKGNGGEVMISGGNVFIPDGAISFGDGTLNGALQAAYNNSGDDNPSYIHSAYISKTKVISPHVYGGDLYATGQGNTAGTNPAFYMSDGVTGSGANTEPNEPKGWLCYDKNGAGTSQEATNRVFLHSEPGVALKLDAGGDMSLEADDSIYFLSYLKLRKGVNYGTAAQRDAITPENGQIFFVME